MKRLNKLTLNCLQKGGRNHQGKITVWHRGGGNKKLYRIIDFKRSLFDIPALVLKLKYDPNRTSKIALICYKNGMLSYILAPKNLKIGDIIQSSNQVYNSEFSVGNSFPVGFIPTGSEIHNVELKPGKGGQLMRAAGTCARIIKKNKRFVIIRLNSGKFYSISPHSMATLGTVSNDLHKNLKLRKAGQSRWRNRRPVVRGMAMNPIDHPHGGGQGRSKGGNHPVTPWGKLTKGKKTINNKKKNKNKFLF